MMASKIGWSVGVLFGFGLACSACGGTTTTTKPANATVCDPGSRRCAGDDIELCDQAGTAETIEQSCAAGQCHVQGSNAFCSTPIAVCKANQAMCAGEIATQCKPDGSGWAPGGVDCAASKQYCLQGKCRDTLCIGGTKSCKDGDVYQCSTDGSSLSVLQSCTDSEVCDEVSGTCLSQRCKPSQATCQGTVAMTCNASGSDWLPNATDCASDGKVCVAGSCEKKACVESTTFCQDGNLYQCDASGSSSTLSQTCRPGIERCEVTPAGLYAYCVAYVCPAGQKRCEGDVLKTCSADNSFPPDGTVCAKNEICENAACKSLGCNLETFFCKGKDVYYCSRAEQSLIQACDPGQACLAVIADPDEAAQGNSQLASCQPLSCPPGKMGCVQNKMGTCGADGASLSAISNDCAANNQICTVSGTCDTSVTDTIGLDANAFPLEGGPYIGNVIEVHSARKLTQLQMWLAFTTARDLHWMVFELVGSQAVARAEKTTSVASSTGFVSSGPLSFSYSLEAGKRYALGLAVPGNAVGYYDMSAPRPLSENPSFGSVNGAVSGNSDFTSFDISNTFGADAALYMKVTTAAP